MQANHNRGMLFDGTSTHDKGNRGAVGGDTVPGKSKCSAIGLNSSMRSAGHIGGTHTED